MTEFQTATIQIETPVRLLSEMQALVEAGWFRSLDELMLDALRRFVESHQTELIERFIREDVEWGLHGKEIILRLESQKTGA
jgi:Arc/MetJ-type ribon-helix-helix transcriptional regulator